MPQFARPSHAIRLITAVITVWCLGCSALDPLIASLFARPGSVFMTCGSEDASFAETNETEPRTVRDAATDEGTNGMTCGCQTCYAPAPAALATAPALPAAPDDPVSRYSAPLSVERAPLVPPPQVVA